MDFLKKISIFSFIILSMNSVISFKLNVPRILLPIFNDIESKFMLEDVEGGCFKWTTTREDLIKLEPLDINDALDCSSKVLITTITKHREKSKGVIIAEDVVNSGIILKCDFIVDVIHNLTITTTTRELYIDDVPEIFQINAYDQQGNEFSTLESIEFDWSISSKLPKKQDPNTGGGVIVRYLPFKDSPYEAPPGIDELENQNKKGSIILLQGLETGVATISVKMYYPEYRHIPEVEVPLVVTANIILLPHEAHIMPGDVLEFSTYIMHNGKLNPIDLKDYKYYLKSEDNDTVRVDSDIAVMTGLKIGYTKVILTNIDEEMNNDLIKLPFSNVYVVEPVYMLLNILPNKNWAILIGDKYDIIVDLYTNKNEKINVGSSTRIQLDIDDSFHIEQQARNGSWLTGWGVREDKISVGATLEFIEHPKFGKFPFANGIIKASAELAIYPKIILTPFEVVLPWDPDTKPKYHVNLTAKGGDGRFLWSSTNTSIGVVTSSGQVHTIKDGHFKVFAAMLRNHHNRVASKFTILKPRRLEINEYIMEAAINEPIYIHLALYGEKYDKKTNKKMSIPFTLCQDIPFQIKLSDKHFYSNRTNKIPTIGMSCDNFAVIGRQVGTCKVTVIYEVDNLILEDSVVINTYNHLKLIQPENEIVLAVGTTVNLLYEGGPKPLIGRNTQHQRLITAIQHDDELDNDIVEFKDISDNYQLADDNTIIWVLCRKLGEIDLQLEINNIPSLPNCKTKPAVLTTQIYCGKPRHIRIQPELKLINTKKCPIDINSDSLIVPTNTNLTLNVDIYDDRGRLFKNASTFQLSWESSVPKRIKFFNPNGIFSKKFMFDDKLPIANGSEQVMSATSEMGLITITTKVLSYDKKKLKKYSIKSEWPEFIDKNDKIHAISPNIETNLNLLFMNSTTVNRTRLMIFNQPDIKRTISVLYGSNYLELKLSTDEIAVVDYNQKDRQIEIIPLKSGELTLEINDLCIISEPILIHILVITVGNIRVEMFEKLEINRCIECIVKLYDEQDNGLEVDDIGSINLKYRLTKQLIKVDLNPVQNNTMKNQISYVITGIEIGYTELVFIYEDKDHEISSQTIQIQVFEPLKVYPRNTTIIISTILQLTIKGGPYPDANLEFESTNDNIEIDLDNGIIIGRKLGTTDVLIRSVGVNPYTGDKVIYCDDRIIVNIVKLNGVRISSPLTKLCIGTTVPVWVSGIPQEISPVILGGLEEGRISFNWQLKQNSVATISDILYPLSIVYSNEDRVSIRLTGINVGITRLTVNVTLMDQLNQPTYLAAFYDFEVIDSFRLIEPSGLADNSILMAPYARLQIKTNFDETHHLVYTLPTEGGCDSSTQLITDKTIFSNILHINDDGKLISTGQAGFGLLVITATDQQGWKRSLTYVVQVKPIHYMMMAIKANWRLNFNTNLNDVIPVGTEFSIVPNFYDNLGNEFHAVPVTIEIRGNRHDLLSLNYFKINNTIKTNIKKTGNTVIKLWTSGETNTADYIRLHTLDVLKPVVDHMVSGDVLCLWSPIVSRDLQLEKWESSDPNLLTIDSNVNVAVAQSDQEGSVYLTNALHPSRPIFLQILPIKTIELLPPADLVISNGPVDSEYRIPLVIKSEKCPDNKNYNIIQGWRCDSSFSENQITIPFKCFAEFTNKSVEVEATDIYIIESGIQLETGQYYCALLVKETNYVPYLATFITNLTLWAITDINQHESEHIILPFLPNVDMPNEIRLTSDDRIAVLDIIGLEEVLKQIQVEAADSSIIYVDSGTFVSPDLLRYRVQVIDYHWKLANLEQVMGINVISPITKQESLIMVLVDDRLFSCKSGWLSNFLHTYRHSLVILLSVVSIFVLTCYVYSRYMRPVVNVGRRCSMLLNNHGNMPCRNQSASPNIPRLNTTHGCNNRLNCSCNPRLATSSPLQNTSQSPVYGDNAYTITSPELRRNRRFL